MAGNITRRGFVGLAAGAGASLALASLARPREAMAADPSIVYDITGSSWRPPESEWKQTTLMRDRNVTDPVTFSGTGNPGVARGYASNGAPGLVAAVGGGPLRATIPRFGWSSKTYRWLDIVLEVTSVGGTNGKYGYAGGLFNNHGRTLCFSTNFSTSRDEAVRADSLATIVATVTTVDHETGEATDDTFWIAFADLDVYHATYPEGVRTEAPALGAYHLGVDNIDVVESDGEGIHVCSSRPYDTQGQETWTKASLVYAMRSGQSLRWVGPFGCSTTIDLATMQRGTGGATVRKRVVPTW